MRLSSVMDVLCSKNLRQKEHNILGSSKVYINQGSLGRWYLKNENDFPVELFSYLDYRANCDGFEAIGVDSSKIALYDVEPNSEVQIDMSDIPYILAMPFFNGQCGNVKLTVNSDDLCEFTVLGDRTKEEDL